VAKNTQLTNAAVNAEADALAVLADHGWIDILDGTQPASGDTAITGQFVLVSCRLGSPFAPAASAGVLTANAIASGTAIKDGTASWFRVYQADHTTPVCDGSAGTSAANLILPTTTILLGNTIAPTGFTHTIPKFTAGA
jgi:hypothetical protein